MSYSVLTFSGMSGGFLDAIANAANSKKLKPAADRVQEKPKVEAKAVPGGIDINAILKNKNNLRKAAGAQQGGKKTKSHITCIYMSYAPDTILGVMFSFL